MINRSLSLAIKTASILTVALISQLGFCQQAPQTGILRKAIPDKLIVLTFDDSPVSGYTVVAPVLRSLKFGGSFYVTDFDGFYSRKDWYLTWRQMAELNRQGFEIGNHTHGHVGGASIEPFLDMEDQLLANGVPKPTTACWPVYAANPHTYPELAANGYLFGRGGLDRAYVPTIDNPFDAPSFTIKDDVSVQTFINYASQAHDGRIVVFTFHGVPDFEHPSVGLEPDTFKQMMQYLKENHYRCIAMRDLAEFINPVEAVKLPQTSDRSSEPNAGSLRAPNPVSPRPNRAAMLPGGLELAEPSSAPNEINRLSLPGIALTADGKILLESPKERANPSEKSDIDFQSKLDAHVGSNNEVGLDGVLSGTGALIKSGAGQLRIQNKNNSFTGGTVINSGSIFMLAVDHGLGAGPVTMNPGGVLELEHVSGSNRLILNGGTIHAGNGFGDTWDNSIAVNAIVRISSYADFVLNAKSGGITGPGGIMHIGSRGPFGMANSGTVSLAGINTYTGPTVVRLGVLRVLKTLSLYNGNPEFWSADHVTVGPGAQLSVRGGGPGEFSGEQLGKLLRGLTIKVNNSGLMQRSVFEIDVDRPDAVVTLSEPITDSTGPGGGAYYLKKAGQGKLTLGARNTFTGKVVVEVGTLSVKSMNSIHGRHPFSSLGAPTDNESGEILLGARDNSCTLQYTGAGEVSDRDINLAGHNCITTLEHAGTGVWKLTGGIAISGYGSNKTLVLNSVVKATGEIASAITDPYDRKGAAVTRVTKTGSGTWILSGENQYSGTTTVLEGVLKLANSRSVGRASRLNITAGGTLDLAFKGSATVRELIVGGNPVFPGRHKASEFPAFLSGTGELVVAP